MSSEHSVVGLVMAAGFSHRFGALDKRALKVPSGATLLAETCKAVTQICPRSWVVLREEDDANKLGLNESTMIIRTECAALGLGASMADGFRALLLAEFADSAAVFLGDMPFIQQATCAPLFEASGKSSIVRPVLNGQPGHPVVFGRCFWPQLVLLKGGETGSTILQRNAQWVNHVPVDTRDVCLDIDRFRDISKLITMY
ncbi:nucleotidyltransferase family protein [Gilvimarinus agarilyticus]|uniref:nucleotidyltransferase family protein n=1 Tax=Gilvimarinus sp. 2_MG-2023 TaxID=3062666 RepID=UPI001C09C631|nr:nucleotidyltransferase family protein [Gilvimarinus sp. 2_MG-2023]MBU2886359.1 nucleotidyltransferase family protein [Gilvimarinus agarilyticus]MDO6571038.1 nucleotidyltransferase family protein [Gilvimarinus sp. 2_MG-2023]